MLSILFLNQQKERVTEYFYGREVLPASATPAPFGRVWASVQNSNSVSPKGERPSVRASSTRPVRDTQVLTSMPPSARVMTTLTVTAAPQLVFSADQDRAETLTDALVSPEGRPLTWALLSGFYRRRPRPRKANLPRSWSRPPYGRECVLV